MSPYRISGKEDKLTLYNPDENYFFLLRAMTVYIICEVFAILSILILNKIYVNRL